MYVRKCACVCVCVGGNKGQGGEFSLDEGHTWNKIKISNKKIIIKNIITEPKQVS